ncbi:zinc finger protein 692 isoform X2 [Brienomyrus brachyistius]|uniref:zinc finger protein 692 isoform X2 n=1 Tax=Brienomyrus brachyistius TaxID=42636 RepID=UPI0020B3C5BC|nr:zinc finger protein 692 isoform X2 [Brienomyrus brachyistius]
MSSRDALRRQRRRELDARRSKSRVRLGGCLQSWGQLKDRLGFALHSELAQYLLESYFSKVCIKCSGGMSIEQRTATIVTSAEMLQGLVLLVHRHGQQCPFPPTLCRGTADEDTCGGQEEDKPPDEERWAVKRCRGAGEAELGAQGSAGHGEGGCSSCLAKEEEQAETESRTGVVLSCTCRGGHVFSWCPSGNASEEAGEGSGGVDPPAGLSRSTELQNREVKGASRETSAEGEATGGKTRGTEDGSIEETREAENRPEDGDGTTGTEERRTGSSPVSDSETGQNVPPTGSVQTQETWKPIDSEEKDVDGAKLKHFSYGVENEPAAISRRTTRGRRKTMIQPSTEKSNLRLVTRDNRNTARGITGDDISQIAGKRKRKATPRDILPCEVNGCDKIFSTRQYLNHHMKYQHFQQKTFTCSHPACGKSFNFKKHLKEHEKLHSNRRDYICEFCARAFRTSSNLIIHRRIHTGEKPLQCEVCGFTCRQKASLNWHMRKHNAESGYQFPCEICGRRFEKRDNVTAHRNKSHPDQSPAPPVGTDHIEPVLDSPGESGTPKGRDLPSPTSDSDGQSLSAV